MAVMAMTPYETMERIKARRKKRLIALAVGLPALVLLVVDYARGGTLAPCPQIWSMECSGTCMATCDAGEVTKFEYYVLRRGWTVRIEPESEILKESFE